MVTLVTGCLDSDWLATESRLVTSTCHGIYGCLAAYQDVPEAIFSFQPVDTSDQEDLRTEGFP